MNRLIQDLLDASRIEAGSVTFEWDAVPVSPLVLDAIEMMRPLAEGKLIALTFEVDPDLPDLRADRERLLQLFSNLLGNAIKFTPEGGTINLLASPSTNGVRFCVRDSGPGILDAHLTKIFDRYWQARRSDRTGAGLGLAIAKGITEAHSGEIWAESRPGEGASFYVTLPTSGEACPSQARRERRLHFMG
ncbi:MAG: HAMP domain-containing sensor histidine kinase [Polyangiaceae bacterium]